MEISDLALKLLLLFLPGLIASLIIDQLIIHKPWENRDWVVFSLVLGFVCYLISYPAWYSLVILLHHIPYISACSRIISLTSRLSFLDSLLRKDAPVNAREILCVSCLAVPVGLIISRVIDKKLLFGIARRFGMTSKHGYINSFHYIETSLASSPWVVIRDLKNDLMYEGWIQITPDGAEKDEIFLRDVKVYKRTTAELMYEVPGLYLSQELKEFRIEFPDMPSKSKEIQK